MQNVNRLNYGNWVPRKMIVVFLLIFCVCCALSVVINIGIVRGILIAVSVIFGALFVYMSYAYWLLGKNGGGLQKELCNALLYKLEWDGQGKALDIGTGSGRIAIYLLRGIHRHMLWESTIGATRGLIPRVSVIEMLKLKV